jgi:CRP-like cAMP-binding protein
MFSIKKLRKHQFLVQEDDEVSNDYWVISGLLKAYHINKGGKNEYPPVCGGRLVDIRLSGLQ